MIHSAIEAKELYLKFHRDEEFTDAQMFELAEVICVDPDIRREIEDYHQDLMYAGQEIPAEGRPYHHADAANPKYHPYLLDLICSIRGRLMGTSRQELPEALCAVMKEDFSLAELIVADPIVVRQILNLDELF